MAGAGKSAGLSVTIALPSLSAEDINAIDSQSEEQVAEVSKLVQAAAPELSSGAVRNVFSFKWGEELSTIVELRETVDIATLKVDVKSLVCFSKLSVVVGAHLGNSSISVMVLSYSPKPSRGTAPRANWR
jgi:hypothetical protein